MDVIDYELRRYESMRNEIDVRKNPLGSTPLSAKASKEKLNNSSDDFLDLMNEERPKEVLENYCIAFWHLRIFAFSHFFVISL